MADENKNSSFSFLDSNSLDQLKSSGLIGDDTYSELASRIAPVEQPVMSTMSPEQAAATAPEVVTSEVSAPAAPALTVPNLKSTPWLDKFTPEGIKKRAEEAALAGDIDEADRLSSEVENLAIKEEEKLVQERERKVQKFESDLAKAQKYNERAAKLGLALIAEPSPEAYGIAPSEKKATDKDIVAANTPSVAEVEQAAAPARKVAAQAIAAENEAAKMAKLESENAAKAALEADKVAAQVKQDIEDDRSEAPNKWGQAFAIMLGAIGSGLTGRENMGLKAIQRIEDQIIEKKKYNDTQKRELRKQLLEEKQFDLKKAEAATDSIEKQMRVKKLQAEITKLLLENNAALKFANTDNTKFLEQREVFQLDPKTQESYVRLPSPVVVKDANGNIIKSMEYAKTLGEKDAAQKLRQYMAETGTVVPELSILRDKISSPDFSKLSIADRAEVQNQLATLVGALRIPITGPGPMTDTERKFILDTIGDPSKIFTLPGVQQAKLNATINTIEGRVRNQYFNAGINLPLSKEERIRKEVDLLHAQNPTIPREVLESIRRKQKGQ